MRRKKKVTVSIEAQIERTDLYDLSSTRELVIEILLNMGDHSREFTLFDFALLS